jgi:hypothetical protein
MRNRIGRLYVRARPAQAMEVVAEKAVTPFKSGRPKMNDAPVTPHTAGNLACWVSNDVVEGRQRLFVIVKVITIVTAAAAPALAETAALAAAMILTGLCQWSTLHSCLTGSHRFSSHRLRIQQVSVLGASAAGIWCQIQAAESGKMRTNLHSKAHQMTHQPSATCLRMVLPDLLRSRKAFCTQRRLSALWRYQKYKRCNCTSTTVRDKDIVHKLCSNRTLQTMVVVWAKPLFAAIAIAS